MRKTKKKNWLYKITAMTTICCALCLSFFVGTPATTYAADAPNNIAPLTDSTELFTVQAEATARRSITISSRRQTVDAQDGTKIYNCFNWRDLDYLTFKFSSKLSNTTKIYSKYSFIMTYLQTDDLSSSFGHPDQQLTLTEGTITNNTFNAPNFYFDIDNNNDRNESATRKQGYGYGLYKFDFNYTVTDEDETRQISIGELYFAILPDDIDNISMAGLSIKYDVASSNKLMNIFKLHLSDEDRFKYVKPEYIQWNVTGKNEDNIKYVLSKKIQKEHLDLYSNYLTIWEAQLPDEPTGSSFIFDSNDIEGTWQVTCTISNSNGTEKGELSISNLSTYKQERKSYLVPILLSILGALLLGGTIGLFIIFKKQQNKSAN